KKEMFLKPCEQLLPDLAGQSLFSKAFFGSVERNTGDFEKKSQNLDEVYNIIKEWREYRKGTKPDFTNINKLDSNAVERRVLRCEAYIKTLGQQVEQYGPDAVRECQNNAQKYLEVI